MRRPAVVAALGAAILCGGSIHAALLTPQAIDANTGSDATDVGAAFGDHQAWAGFLQKTNGAQRLYVTHAQDGVFAAPQLADSGNAVTSAALAGGDSGNAVVVFTEGTPEKLFGRRLTNGQLGPIVQISKDGQDAQILNLFALHHRQDVAENDAGDAAVCYVDAATGDAYAAVLGAQATAWTRFGPLKSTECDDIAVDANGDAIVLGQDAGMHPSTDRIVGGALHSEEVDAHGKDEPSLAVSANRSAIVFARTDTSSGAFAGSAWLMKDIAAGGAWQSLGTIDNGARASTENLEFARGALAPNGRGIVTFRINNPAAGTSRDYVEQVDTGAATPIGAPQKLADVSTGGDAIPVVDANGNGLALYHHMVDGNPEPVVRDFVPNAPAQEIVLGSNVEVLPVGSFQADAAGDFVAFARTGTAPVHVHAIFGDFVPPTLEPKSDSATAVLGQQTTLHGGATDAFAQLGANAVTWQFPAGSIFGPTDLTGSDVDVRFATVGNVVVEVSATDAAGNTASASLTVRVIAHAKLHAVPASAHTGARMKLVGAGFAPAKAVSLVMGPPRANVTARFGAVRADARGNFSKSVFVSKKTRAGRYVLIACQLKCRVKATAAVRVR